MHTRFSFITSVILDSGNYLISSSRYLPEWVIATKTLPMRAWDKDNKVWRVPRNKVSVAQLHELYGRFGDVSVSYGCPETTPQQISQKYPFLYPFQAQAVASTINTGSFLIAHEMGCGKTVTSMAAALELAARQLPQAHVLVISPASIQTQWQTQVKKWFNADLAIVSGTKKKRTELWKTPGHKIVSYESFRQDWPKTVGDISNYVIIADETSKIKNNSQIYKVFKDMGKRVKHRIGATGTPISGRLEHYYRIMKWVNPTWLSAKEFEEKYIVWDTIWNGVEEIDVVAGYKNLDDFVKRLEGFVDRKRKDDIGIQLPPKTLEWRRVAFTAEQRKMHGALLYYAEMSGEGVLPVWTLLHTVSDGTEVTLESKSEILSAIPATVVSEESPKLKEIDGILEEIGDEKVLIYAQFARFARHIVEHLNRKANARVAMLATGDDAARRDASVASFLNDPTVKYLVSTDTLAMGVSFSDVNYEIQADIPADISIFQQRCERIHRMDSKYPKTIIALYSEGIEEEIYKILERKDWLNDQVLEGNAVKQDVMSEIGKKYGLVRKPFITTDEPMGL